MLSPTSHLGATSVGSSFQRLEYPGIASIIIQDGSSITIQPGPTVGPDVVELLIAGPALGVLLHQRGALVQHASAIRHQEGALVFTGGSTWGKSTTAAFLYGSGFGIVADDVVPLSVSHDVVTTVPGYPACKLWPDAASALGLDPDAMPTIGLEAEKRRLDALRGFEDDPLRVSRIYVLSQGNGTRIEPIEGQAAFVELVRHSYLARYLGDPADQRRRFTQAERVVRSVVIRRLVQGSLDELPMLPDLIAEDLATSA